MRRRQRWPFASRLMPLRERPPLPSSRAVDRYSGSSWPDTAASTASQSTRARFSGLGCLVLTDLSLMAQDCAGLGAWNQTPQAVVIG